MYEELALLKDTEQSSFEIFRLDLSACMGLTNQCLAGELLIIEGQQREVIDGLHADTRARLSYAQGVYFPDN